MSIQSKSVVTGIVAGIVTFLIMMALLTWVQPWGQSPENVSNSSSDEDQVQSDETKTPLYWVAPMDANYQRDKPGKSPMGMDLVPVYATSSSTITQGVGTIVISPNVVNNLGVRTAIAKKEIIKGEINTVGYVTYDKDKLIHIHPRVEGWIEKLYVKTTGASVVKNQPLYDMYSPELVNAQEEYVLALTRKNTRLINAAENRLMSLNLSMPQIVELKKSKTVKQRITFYAPQNGVVENLKVREGFFVKPGTKLMSIGDLSQVWIEAEVFERQTTQVRLGSKASVTLDFIPGKTFEGKVDFIYPTINLKNRALKVRLRLNNPSGEFKPNMYAKIVIHAHDQSPTLLIPKEALIRTGSQDRVVLALGEGHFKSIAVNVGRFDGDSVEILSGLNEGENVVSSAQFLLDSESSKTSDFERLHHEKRSGNEINKPVSSATTKGIIKGLMPNMRMVTISRDAIEKWQRPAATVDFIVANSVELNLFTVGKNIDFTFEIQEGNFVIVDVQQDKQQKQNKETK